MASSSRRWGKDRTPGTTLPRPAGTGRGRWGSAGLLAVLQPDHALEVVEAQEGAGEPGAVALAEGQHAGQLVGAEQAGHADARFVVAGHLQQHFALLGDVEGDVVLLAVFLDVVDAALERVMAALVAGVHRQRVGLGLAGDLARE